MAGFIPLQHWVRIARVIDVGYNYVQCDFIDRFGEKSFDCPVPHPYAGSHGGGIFVGVQKDTIVLVSKGPSEQWYIVCTVPDINFFAEDLGGIPNMRLGDSPYPNLRGGEISIKGNKNQRIDFLVDGNIGLDAMIGSGAYDIELSRSAQAIFFRTNNVCKFTEAGRSIEGILKRDIGEDYKDSGISDFLSSEQYDRILTAIGRSPNSNVSNITTTNYNSILRNPSFVEKRNIIYEFGESFNAGNPAKEARSIESIKKMASKGFTTADIINSIRKDPNSRENKRSDVLNINPSNYNHLIESVQGTLVDIYGNILDLNRHKIAVPDIYSILNNKSISAAEDLLDKIYKYLRRSVKYHFEINSRKDAHATNDANLQKLSRFSIDIDAEGLTKVNIPASSNTGNVPLLGRYTNSSSSQNPSKDKTDVLFNPIGPQTTATITDQSYIPKTTNKSITIGSAFHDIYSIANSVFSKQGKVKNPSIIEDQARQLNTNIINAISAENPNAGGRSISLNLDGSMEASIGADNIDKKSIVLDTAGSLVACLGRDGYGRSILGQTDGDIILQVGGVGVGNDTANRPGRLEIHFNRPAGNGLESDPSKIIIDENGITLYSAGRMVLESRGDMILSSEANVLINGEGIKQFGSIDRESRTVRGAETRVTRIGRLT